MYRPTVVSVHTYVVDVSVPIHLYMNFILVETRQVSGFVMVLRFAPPIKLTATI